jgi:hypothetical protein
MGKWWKNTVEKVGDAIEDVLEDGVDLVKNGKCYQTVSKIQESGKECYQLARDTSELCHTTLSRGQEMIDFGSEITSTLRGFSMKMDVETLETIKDLMDGDRLRESMKLAKDMDDIALSCVDKSVRMMEIMEDAMDAVPDPIQRMITKAAGRDDIASRKNQEKTREVLSTLDQDLDDVKSCVKAVQHLNIATALQLGLQAFEHLSAKATVSRSMFNTMRGFSDEVASFTEAISEGDVSDMVKLAGKVGDMWHCLKLSNFMQELAEAAGKLIRMIISLFKVMSERLSTLWKALAYAKDCMVDCMEHVVDAKKIVLKAHKNGELLIEKSKHIIDQLQDLGELNGNSIKSARKLAEGGEIKKAIALTGTMDDLVLECVGKVVAMVERVSEGFQNLPDILTANVNLEEEGKQDDDREPDDIEQNIAQLEKSRGEIDESNIVSAAVKTVGGFRDVLDNEMSCQDMLGLVEGFTGNCSATIKSFLGVWDLNSAMVKITEMCRIVRLGELIKKFAEQIKRLLNAIIALMKSAIKKLSMDLGDAVDDIKDKIEDVTDKLKFWK